MQRRDLSTAQQDTLPFLQTHISTMELRPCETNGYGLKQLESCTKPTPASEEDTCNPEFTVLRIKNPQNCEESCIFRKYNLFHASFTTL